MRKTGTITINEKIITINELTARQIYNLKDGFGAGVMDALKELLPLVTDASPDFLLDLAPSELRALYDKVKEVNSDFFDLIPLDKILAGYKDTVLQTINNNLSTLSAASSAQATALPPGTTAGDFLPAA